MRFAPLALALALAAGLTACGTGPVVPLVELHGLAPRQVELGDKLEIDGVGFPEGRDARVVFAGTLSRPGQAVEPDAEIDARGEVVAQGRIEIAVTDELLAAFCGAGSSAVHTTFDGSVTVVFAARSATAVPVAGSVQHTTVDLLPAATGQARFLANAEDGEALARASGLHVAARPSGELVVTGVEPRSRAAAAGLATDDVLVSAGGVRALGVADLAPPPGALALALVVRRAGTEEQHELAIDGVRAEPPRRFAWPASLVAVVAALLLLGAASPGRAALWLRRRLASVPSRAGGLSASARGVGLLTVAALPLAAPAVDVSVLALVAFSAALALALVAGTAQASTARAVLDVAGRIAPAAAALAFALVVAGSLRADELTAAQGAAPWGYFALRSPAHALLAFSFCAAAARRCGERPVTGLSQAAELVLARVTAGLAVVVFFGGWRLPFASPHVRGAFAWLGAAVFVAKTAAVAGAIERVRAALPARALGAHLRSAFLRLTPLSVAAGLGALAWEKHVTSRGLGAATTFALTALAAAALLQLVWPPPSRVAVDPMS